MSVESAKLISTVKRVLKSRNLTYAELAKALNLSESSVKRIMSSGQMSLDRLLTICSAMDCPLEELVGLAAETQSHTELALSQEQALADDPTLLTYFYLLLAGWSPQDISERYEIDDLAAIRLQSALDKLGLIEVLPGDRVKLLTARQIVWRRDGPVRRSHERRAMAEFFDSRFTEPESRLITNTGELSAESIIILSRKITELTTLFEELATMDTPLPPESKQGFGLIAAMRPWVFSVFNERKRP